MFAIFVICNSDNTCYVNYRCDSSRWLAIAHGDKIPAQNAEITVNQHELSWAKVKNGETCGHFAGISSKPAVNKQKGAPESAPFAAQPYAGQAWNLSEGSLYQPAKSAVPRTVSSHPSRDAVWAR